MMDLSTIYWVKIIAILIVFVAIMILFLRNSIAKSNISGAKLVKKELDQLDDSYIIFDNVIVQSDRGMLQISHVVVSPYGIFVVTLCEVFGKISGHMNDREWVLKTKSINDTITNPLWENRKHVNALEKKIGPQPFIPLVVFTHSKLINDFGPVAVLVDELKNFFYRYTNRVIDLGKVEAIVVALNDDMQPPLSN